MSTGEEIAFGCFESALEHSPHPAMPLFLLKHCCNRQIHFIADASGVLCFLVNFMTLKTLILDQLSAFLLGISLK